MKKYLSLVSAALLTLTACQNDDFVASVAPDGEGNFTITLNAPEAMSQSRTYSGGPATFGPNSSSALGGITNVDWDLYDLRYKISIYQKNTLEDSSIEYIKVLDRVETVDTYQPVSLSFRLTTNRSYRIVAWADFVTQGSQEDLHYNTDDLSNITEKDAHVANDESRDAYYRRIDFTVGGDNINSTITLYRPFAKLRFVTTDWALDDLEMTDEFTVTYKNCTRYAGFNALLASPIDPQVLDDVTTVSVVGSIDRDQKEYALNYDQTDHNRTLLVDYMWAGASLNPIHMEFAPSGLAPRDITVDIPTRQNFLTTILGNLLTNELNLTFECDEMFRNEYNNYYITASEAFTPAAPAVDTDGAYLIASPNNLVWLEQLINANATDANMKVKLIKDINLEGYNWKPMNYSNHSDGLVFDGQGHKIHNLNIDAEGNDYDGLFSWATNVIVKNLTIENFTLNNGGHCAGAIAGVIYGAIENCTINHSFMRQPNYDTTLAMKYNYGGLIGIWYSYGDKDYIRDCHAVNVNLQAVGRAGGIVAFVHNDSADERTIENCTSTECMLNDEVYPGFAGDPSYSTYWFKQIGAIAGCISDTITLDITGCSSSDITYIYGFAVQKSMVWLHSGDEGSEHYYTDPYSGATVPVGPATDTWGFAYDGAIINGVTITNE